MALKTYRTYFLKSLQILVRDSEGKRVECIFRGGIQVDSTARYTTDNAEIQKKLESLSGFGRTYYLESVIGEEEPKREVAQPETDPKQEEAEQEKPLTDVKDIKRFKNLVEMRAAMAELGIEGTENMNYVQAKAAAAKAGYDFQIQR